MRVVPSVETGLAEVEVDTDLASEPLPYQRSLKGGDECPSTTLLGMDRLMVSLSL